MKTRKILCLICALLITISMISCDLGGTETGSETSLNSETQSSLPTEDTTDTSTSYVDTETNSEKATDTSSETQSNENVTDESGESNIATEFENPTHTETVTETDAVIETVTETDAVTETVTEEDTLKNQECQHYNAEWKVTTDPTCTSTGTKDNFCLDCGIMLDSATVETVAHIEEIVEGRPATCTVEGLTDGKKCSYCDAVLLEQSVISTIPHTEEVVKGHAATCTEDGLTDGTKCKTCDTVLTAQEKLSALGHNESDWIIDFPATSDSEGSKYTKCTRCNDILQTVTIPKIDSDHVHSGEEWLVSVPPTCTEEGVGYFVCACGTILDTKSVPCIPHTEVILAAVSATCTSTGLTEGKQCSTCKNVLVEQTVTEKLPHTEETLAAVSATCTSTGLTEGKQCSTCKDILVEQTTTEKLPHIEETLAAVAATCTSTGLTEGKKCSVCNNTLVEQTPTAKTEHIEKIVPGTPATCTDSGITDGKICSECSIILETQLYIPPAGHNFVSGTCTGCGEKLEMYGIWIVDGLGNPVNNVIVKILKDGNMVKMYQYKGEYLTFDIEKGNYTIELDLSMLGKSYTYDESLLVLTPTTKNVTIRLFESVKEPTEVYVGYPLDKDYNAYEIGAGSYFVDLTPNDYTFFIFRPTTAAIYTITYESSSNITISYHGASFFIQGNDVSEGSSEFAKYENGLSFSVYGSNIGGDYVFGIKSNNATSCVLNIENVGDPGTRLEEEPWVPYLEADSMVNKQLSASKDGTYTAIDLTDMSVCAVYNEADGYYHLGSENGPIIFIDLSSDSKYVSSITTICANQRIGSYIYDADGKLAEKRSYNELFFQYGIPSDGSAVDEPIRVPLTKKLAEAIQKFGDKNGWWGENLDVNIFNKVHLGAAYNQEYAWLLYCGIYQ